MPLVVNSRSRYARRLASVLSTPTDLKRFSQVPLDSSAASSPLPLATIAAAVLDSRFRSIDVLVAGGVTGKRVILTRAANQGNRAQDISRRSGAERGKSRALR